MGAPPPIRIRCDCGEARAVPYGETWSCEECGRRWDTHQIPANEYLARVRRMRRFRVELFGLLALGVAVFVPLVLLVSSALILVAGMISLFFFIWYMPLWRRRVRRAAAEAPTWELHPE